MKLYLMRHGETDFNMKHLFYGSTDISINQSGSLQAQKIASHLKDVPIDIVYASELSRTLDTAKIIFPDMRIVAKQAFNERDFGQWEGLNANEIQKKFPIIWEAWLNEPFDITPPGAERFSDFKKRVSIGIDDLLSEDKESNIAVVGHLGVLRLFYQRLIDPSEVFWDIQFPQGSVICFNQIGDKWFLDLV